MTVFGAALATKVGEISGLDRRKHCIDRGNDRASEAARHEVR